MKPVIMLCDKIFSLNIFLKIYKFYGDLKTRSAVEIILITASPEGFVDIDILDGGSMISEWVGLFVESSLPYLPPPSPPLPFLLSLALPPYHVRFPSPPLPWKQGSGV